MTLRSRAAIAGTVVPVAKVYGNAVPPQILAAEQQQQMTPSSPFGPGEPIGPYDGYSRQPRTREFTPGYNIATRPRLHERVSFDTLHGLIESYDVAQMCCVPGTEIITKRGLVPIEDVAVGDEVVTHLGRWRRVTQTMTNRPHAPVRILKSSGFEDLAVTGNHPVYAIDYRVTQTRKREARNIGWISADKMRPRGPLVSHSYDALVLPALDLAEDLPVLDVVQAVESKTGKRLAVDDQGIRTRRVAGEIRRVPAQVKMDAALGRMLGWYMAEGSTGKDRQVFFSLGPDEREYCEQILADAEAVFGLQGNIIPTAQGNGLQVRISSTVLAALFSCGTARIKRLPEWAWAGGREFFAAMLDGWATGDGCRFTRGENESPRVEVSTSSRDLAWQMRMVAITLGHAATVVTMRDRDKYNAVIRGRKINTNPISYHVAWRENPKRWGRESFEFDGRYLATALVSAEDSDYDGPVYNLEVEEDHSYVTTGGTVHNCIWHRIDTLRSVKFRLVPAEGYSGDVTGAIEIGLQALKKPDRRHYFKNWLAKWLYDVLAFDAGALYRLRNRGGRCIGLQGVDGTSLAPLLDYWGNEPEGDAPSHVQYVNGLPWNWLTRSDLIYEPMRGVNKSIYGKAPIETIILSSNTDLRFQLRFLQQFTEGNIPEAFASAPESWGPEQIENWQNLWDSFMYGDQARKSQIRWMPGGSTIMWSNEKEFTDAFSLFLMRKCCAAFHVVPTDLGFTDNSNYSTGESQADVAHKVGELPLMEYVEEILSQFLYDDLGLPLKFEWDRGEDQDDRATQAQADQVYINSAVVSADEIREMRFGLPVDAKRPVPRVFFTERGGPIPLNAVLGVAGPNDPESYSPAAGAKLPEMVFPGVPAVMDATVLQPPIAESEYGPAALPPAPPQQPAPPGEDGPVTKEGEAAPGITAETGLSGYDLDRDDEDDKDDDTAAVAKAELAAFAGYRRKRRRAREWRDFRFTAVDKVTAHRLNDAGRLTVRKDAGQVAVAGLAVRAADTGRVLMIQRANDPGDPAAGKLEVPGGHIEGDESPLRAAWREFCEETGTPAPPGVQTGEWTAGDGIYRGIVWTTESEADVPVRGGAVIPNPDDPDADAVEAIMWVDPADLPGNPMVRDELAASLPDVLPLLGYAPDGPAQGDEDTCPCGTPVVYDEANGWQHADGSISHDDGESVSDKMTVVAKAYPDGQSYGSHAFRPTAGWPNICHYCGVGASDPHHGAYRDVAKAGEGSPKALGPDGR